MSADILERIVTSTRSRLASERVDLEGLQRVAKERATARGRRRFCEALVGVRASGAKSGIIAETKAASPSAGTIVEDPDVAAIARSYKEGGAVALSVVTEPHFFHGEREWLALAGETTGLPVIMKDFVIDPIQILHGVAAGADAILLLASLLDGPQIREFIALMDELNCDALVEVHDDSELERAVEGGARLIGVNNRNLRDFSVDLATSEKLGQSIPSGVIKVSESGIRSRSDVERLEAAGFDAFLVGESLLRQSDRAAAVRLLAGQESAP